MIILSVSILFFSTMCIPLIMFILIHYNKDTIHKLDEAIYEQTIGYNIELCYVLGLFTLGLFNIAVYPFLFYRFYKIKKMINQSYFKASEYVYSISPYGFYKKYKIVKYIFYKNSIGYLGNYHSYEDSMILTNAVIPQYITKIKPKYKMTYDEFIVHCNKTINRNKSIKEILC